MDNLHPFYTVGHAARTAADLYALLKGQGVTVLVDVRSVPRSRTNPQFNEENLPLNLKDIQYLRIAELGGFRAKSKTIPPETNAFWQNNSFHSYADYAMGNTFRNGLNKLLELGKTQTAALMCAEMLWWRCHRRIIADYLLAAGQRVYHIISENNVKPACLSLNARLVNGVLRYPIT